MWRPDNWENPYRNKGGCWEKLVFERGADATLEALKKSGDHYDNILELDRLTRQYLPDVEGGFTLCIIPDEEVK